VTDVFTTVHLPSWLGGSQFGPVSARPQFNLLELARVKVIVTVGIRARVSVRIRVKCRIRVRLNVSG